METRNCLWHRLVIIVPFLELKLASHEINQPPNSCCTSLAPFRCYRNSPVVPVLGHNRTIFGIETVKVPFHLYVPTLIVPFFGIETTHIGCK